MATRERRHAYFCFLQTHQISKDMRVCWPPQKIIVPFSRHGFTDYTNNKPLAVDIFLGIYIWLYQKFFVPLQLKITG